MPNNKTFPLRLPQELYNLAEARASRDGVSVSELIRDSLEQRVSRPCPRCKGSGVES